MRLDRLANRIALLGGLLLALASGAWPAVAQAPPPAAHALERLLAELWPLANRQGVTRATFDQAFSGVTVDPAVIGATRAQPEYAKPVGRYLVDSVSAARIAIGQRKAKEWETTLAAIEQKFGVDRYVVVAIWGLESGFGGVKPNKDVIRSMATLAQARYRDDFFREELIAALLVLQNGHIRRQDMLGSWAGAMGQPQFMPSSFLKYAVDFDGDGKADIWNSVPDVLASIANYLRVAGWQPRQPWGHQVTIPPGFDFMRSRGDAAEWTRLGVRRADGGAELGKGELILFFPSGAGGPAFLAGQNYHAIKTYNISDAYTLAVAHLADRMHGAAPFKGTWPDGVPLPREERVNLQRLLAQRGFKVTNFAGQIDFDLRDDIRKMQAQFAMTPDGNPTPQLMQQLRAAAPR
jgi:peptidoglycan lytic transglycosylase B